jgi:Bacterial protein of unknown function (DUF839)
MRTRSTSVLAAAVAASGLSSLVRGQTQGPSTLQTPYVLPTVPGVVTKSIASNGNGTSALTPDETFARTGGGAPYRLVGIADGLGAFDNGDNTFTLLMNHELGATTGIVRGHGSVGSFVSRWIIDKNTHAVISASDLVQNVTLWNPATTSYNPSSTFAFGRLCSADLAAPTAYFNAASGLGTQNRIYMNGEEIGAEGKGFAHLLNGQSFELPRLGKFSWENSVASPFAQNRTVVIGLDDSTPGQVYLYVGNKTNTGNDIERAGLTNGNLFGIQVPGVALESRPNGLGGVTTFTAFNKGNVENQTGAQIQANSVANGVTEWLRPEDGQWDPRPGKQNDFYFVTTDRFNSLTNPGTPAGQDGRSRLWRLRFNDIGSPETGGTVQMLMDGTEGQEMFDNMTIDSHGRVLIQEDPGNQGYQARVWLYDIDTAGYGPIAQFDTSRFGAPGLPAVAPFSTDEESSGIIDVGHILGDGWFLMDVQAHYGMTGANATELVEGSQLIAMHVPTSIVPEPAAVGAVAMAAAGVAALRRRIAKR